jgi:predicted Zn-dependent protease with MMP-like domain
MDNRRFESLVTQAVEGLPEEFQERMENVDIVIADRPTRRQDRPRRGEKPGILLGLYEGVPLTDRGDHYGFVMPDKITIFQKNIEAVCRNDDEVVVEVRKVVIHEIAHHFGISDARLDELGWG